MTMKLFNFLSKKDNTSNRSIGYKGEKIACKYLKKHGYKILKRNYQIRGGEIDIIARHQNQLAFIEVKYRTNFSYGSGVSAVNNKKLANIIYTAERFLNDNEQNKSLSSLEPAIEVIEIYQQKNNKKPTINHYKDLNTSKVKRK